MRSHRPTAMARKLRRNATDAEQTLRWALQSKAAAWKFRRQHPIGRRIADFACLARRLVVELEGGQHDAPETVDALRTQEIARYCYRVIQFWNNEVRDNLDGVMLAIMRERFPPPHPDPLRPAGAERES